MLVQRLLGVVLALFTTISVASAGGARLFCEYSADKMDVFVLCLPGLVDRTSEMQRLRAVIDAVAAEKSLEFGVPLVAGPRDILGPTFNPQNKKNEWWVRLRSGD